MLNRYKIHTTSPSFPILISLDLARAQIVSEGKDMIEHTINLAKQFQNEIANNSQLSMFSINQNNSTENLINDDYMMIDPTKVSINIELFGIAPWQLRKILCNDYSIYFSRYTNNSLLFNFHIGIDDLAVEHLITALKKIQNRFFNKNKRLPTKTNNYVIAYPPGTPLVVPVESLSSEMIKKIGSICKSGVEIIII